MSRKYEREHPTNDSMVDQKCVGPECDRPAKARFLCLGHYTQYRRGRKLRPLRGYVDDPFDVTNIPGHGYEQEDMS